MATDALSTTQSPNASMFGDARSPADVLTEIAPVVVPILYQMAEWTWPRQREQVRKRFGIVGPEQRVREELPAQYKILLRRQDLATLRPSYRLEAGGPVEFFDWDESGRVGGAYGIRYPVYSICPVYDEVGNWSGFALNGRPSTRNDGCLSAIDARLECALFVRSTDPTDLISAFKSLDGKPRVEEARPGMEPTRQYFDLLQRENKQLYMINRGANQYVGPGWTSNTLRLALEEPWVRAIWISDPKGPNATPTPSGH